MINLHTVPSKLYAVYTWKKSAHKITENSEVVNTLENDLPWHMILY